MNKCIGTLMIALLIVITTGCESSSMKNQTAKEVVASANDGLVLASPTIEPTPNKTLAPEPTKKPYNTTIFDSETAEKYYGELAVSFTAGGGSSGIGTGKVMFIKNGESGQVLVENINKLKVEDVDNDGISEIIISRRVPIGGVPNSEYPLWDDVYNFDFTTKKLIFNSTKHPEYYKKFYIEHNKKDAPGSIRTAINLRIANIAKLLIDNEFVPDENLKNVITFLNY